MTELNPSDIFLSTNRMFKWKPQEFMSTTSISVRQFLQPRGSLIHAIKGMQ